MAESSSTSDSTTSDSTTSDSGTSGIARRRAAARDEANPAYVERRREIVEAAGRVFKRKGLAGSNLGDIATESGADRASLYYYVGSKEELFHEVVQEVVSRNLQRAREIRRGDGTAPRKLRMLIVELMHSYEEHYPMLYVYIQENLSHVPDKDVAWAREMRRMNREYEEVVVGLVQDGYDEGTLRPAAPAWITAYGIMGMVGWTNRWFNPDDGRASGREIGEAFADSVLGGLELPASGAGHRTS